MIKRSAILALHIGYWLLYLLLISMFVLAIAHFRPFPSVRKMARILFFSPLFLGVIFPAIISFYTFYTLLFTRFLRKKKFIKLSFSAALVALSSTLIASCLIAFIGAPQKKYQIGELMAMAGIFSLIALIHGIIALVMRGFIAWYSDIRLKEQLNKKNYQMELALVKSQINPHFLFNTINNIDVLIEKDAVKASAYLNKLSDIMRFMLYETKTEKIPLSKELQYIEKYIDLQRIRTSNPNYVNYAVEGDPCDLMIEPMLFIPFIENAFKHAEGKKSEDAIKIRFSIGHRSIAFNCENRYSVHQQERPDHSGLGNDLIKKRLTLLYPGKHSLDIVTSDGIYKAKLTLDGNID